MARDRSFTIIAEDYETEAHYREAVRQALLDCEAIGYREGGAFVVTPIRLEQAERFGVREFETLGWMFSHTFMPAAKVAEPEPAIVDLIDDYEDELEDTRDASLDAEIAEQERLAEPVEAE